MSDNQWLQELKAGDEVYIPKRYGRGYKKYIVNRTTNTQIMVVPPDSTYELKYKKSDGCSIGTGVWDSSRLYKATKEIVEECELSDLTNQVIYMRDSLKIPQTKAELESLISTLKPFVKEAQQ